MKLYVATYVDYGETCDGKARTLGVYTNKKEAEEYINDDIACFVDNNPENDLSVDYDKMRVWCDNSDIRCEWNINEVLSANVCMK